MECEVAPPPTDRKQRLLQFGKAIDEIRHRAEASVGADDVAHIRRMRRASTAFEVVGRTLIHVSPEPLSFLTGVLALFVHKQLETTEIGHTVLHGAYDGLPGAEAFASRRFRWRTAVDEESWRVAHNVRHHQYTNIGGRDPDIHFGPVRLTTLTPHTRFHYVQVPWLLWEASVFLFGINVHVTGVIDAVLGNGRPEKLDFLADRSAASMRRAFHRMLRKLVPHLAREYVLFPALAGPLFAKVLLGNWLSATMCNLYSAATIYCGHVGVEQFPDGARAHGRGEWYGMQVESSRNFDVPLPLSILCGALDRQIEHHLFPQLPTNRLREISAELRAVCEQHGVQYRSDTWPRTLRDVLRHLWRLSFPDRPLHH
ncbi:MAG: putative LINOLEOYL-CoA [bacterium]|nr:putative LINOLEOYL-CoA [bacterium]